MEKTAADIYDPKSALEQVVQETYHALVGPWLTTYQVRQITAAFNCIDGFSAAPKSFCVQVFDQGNDGDLILFPIHTLELRNVLRTRRINGMAKLVGFGYHAGRRVLKDFSALLAIDPKKLPKGVSFKRLRGVCLFDGESLDFGGAVARVVSRARLDSRENATIERIVKEEYPGASVHSLLEVPGLAVPKTAQADPDAAVPTPAMPKRKRTFIVNIPAVGIKHEPHHADSEEEAVQIALDAKWRATGNPHKGTEFVAQTYKQWWPMVVHKAQQQIKLTPTEEKIFDLLLRVNRDHDLNATFRVAGGWVRDKMLGQESDDIDIALDNMTGEQFGGYLSKYIGKAGNVIKANPDQSKHLETMTVRIHGQDVDFVNLRTETYADSRIPKMKFGTPEQDALRRDLTINAMFYNVNTGQVEDFTGKGESDLRSMTLRTPLDPVRTFLDDPLRILRMLRFQSRYDTATPDEAAFEAMRNPEVQNALRTKVTQERVAEELKKLCAGKCPDMALRIAHITGILDIILDVPETRGFSKFAMNQNSPHHKYDVFEHTMRVVAGIKELGGDWRLVFAGLLHDLGKLDPQVKGYKPKTEVVAGEKVQYSLFPKDRNYNSYHGHEDVSAKVARAVCEKLKLSNDDTDYIVTVVGQHMEPHKGDDHWNNKNIRKYLNQYPDTWRDTILHSIADLRATGTREDADGEVKERFALLNRFETMPPPPPKPVLDGREIMAMFPDLKPESGYIADLNKRIMDAQFQNPSITKEAAVELVNGLSGEIRGKYAGYVKPYNRKQTKVARDTAEQVCGKVVKKPFAQGSKSEHEAIMLSLDDGTGEYVLRRHGESGFRDEELEKLVGRKICAKGMIHGHVFIMSQWTPQLDREQEGVTYMERDDPKDLTQFQAGDRVRRRNKGLAFPQLEGTVNRVVGDLMYIKWDGIKDEEVIKLTDTVALHGLIGKA